MRLPSFIVMILLATALASGLQATAMDFFNTKRLDLQTDLNQSGHSGLIAVYEEGLDALEHQDFDVAVTAFNKLRQVAKRDAIVNYYLGIAKRGQGKIKAARKYLETAVTYGGQVPEVRREYALVLIDLGQHDKARAQLSQLVTMMEACGEACPQERRLSIAHSGAAIANALGLYDNSNNGT